MVNPNRRQEIADHRVHPALVTFPLAFFVATFICDLVYWGSGYDAWATAAIWLLGAGIAMAALAAGEGLTDVLGDRRIGEMNDVRWRAGGNAIVVVIELFNWYARHQQGSVMPAGAVLSLVAVCILAFIGWKRWDTMHRRRAGIGDDRGARTMHRQSAAPRAQDRAA
jgi:uncharacterized membrane protein